MSAVGKGRNGSLNSKGGQGMIAVKLCPDCKHRPTRYRINPHAPACVLRPALDAWEARQACGGREWVLDR